MRCMAAIHAHRSRIVNSPSRLERAGLLFLTPGELACDWAGIEDTDSRFLLRMFVNLSLYGKLAVLLVLPFV